MLASRRCHATRQPPTIPLEASLDEPLAVRRAVTDAAALAATMRAATTRAALAGRSVVLVGLMGAGKTTIGKRLATKLQLPFHDADAEIERAAGCSIAEMFERWGETAFRAGERRVIRRLLEGGPMVLATGGGAYMDPLTRALIRHTRRQCLAALPARGAGAASRWPASSPAAGWPRCAGGPAGADGDPASDL